MPCERPTRPDRRRYAAAAAGAALLGTRAAEAAGASAAGSAGATAETLLHRALPRSDERLPAVGLGTWQTFHVDIGDAAAMARRRAVLERFYAYGGRVVDSSPMYATAEQVLGLLHGDLIAAGRPPPVWSAGKVWTPLAAAGDAQMAQSLRLWRLARFDLMQIHNLLSWRGHLKTLRAWQDAGRARLLGVTTSHGNKPDEMRTVLREEGRALAVMQISYSPADRSAEALIAEAAGRGLGVIVNRPFDGGALLSRLAGRPMPGIAGELGCATWAALVLKWELANPAVTCTIPATTNPLHAEQNLAALRGRLPDAREREAILRAIEREAG